MVREGTGQRKREGRIPAGAARIRPLVAAGDGQHLAISFAYFNDGESEIDRLDAAAARKALRSLRSIGAGSTMTLSECNIRMDTVPNQRPYHVLFRGLTEDVAHLNHLNISSGGRVFFFLTSNVCHVVAIRARHYE